MMHEQRWELRYQILKDGEWVDKVCYPRSEEKRAEEIEKLKTNDHYRFVSCKKMYPFSMTKNQHNFELIRNVCFNRMHDMESGEIPFDQREYDRLFDLRERASDFFGRYGEITWMVWDDLKDAKELVMLAVNHRMCACIANGRPDLVQYC